MRFEDSVLARRFTIICLVAMIFGMGFANLVISRPAHAYQYEAARTCILKFYPVCQTINQANNEVKF